MELTSFSTLLLATVLTGPALFSAFVSHELEPRTALIRLLIAVPVAAIMIWALRALTGGYVKKDVKKDEEPGPVQAEGMAGEPFNRRSVD